MKLKLVLPALPDLRRYLPKREHLPILQLILVWCLVIAGKLWYRQASAEDLDFLLNPTANGASLVLSLPFEASRAGYISGQVGILISQECSGGNFLLIALLAGFFALLPSWGHSGWLLPTAALLAYGLTLVANIARICCLVLVGSLTPIPGWLHLCMGTAVYLSMLIPYSLLLSKHTSSLSYAYPTR